MQDKTFWSILGALVLGWIVLFYMLVVGGGMKTYSEKSSSLKSKVRAMKDFAEMAPEDLPTEELLDRKTAEIEAKEKMLADAQQFFIDRENRLFAGAAINNKAAWEGRYRDQYALLGDEYRRAHPPAEDAEEVEDLPFALLENKILEGDLSQAERLWRTQKLVVEAVLDAGGDILSADPANRSTLRSAVKAEKAKRPRFELDRVNTLAELPATKISPLLATLLAHPELNLEVESLTVGKNPQGLIAEVVREGEEHMAEPMVFMNLSLNVLKFIPEPETEQ